MIDPKTDTGQTTVEVYDDWQEILGLLKGER